MANPYEQPRISAAPEEILTVGGKPGAVIAALAKARDMLVAPKQVTKSMGGKERATFLEADAVIDAARKALQSAGLVLTVSVLSTRFDMQNRSEVLIALVFTAADGSRMVHHAAGSAINGMGKAVQCAQTAAVKAGLRYVLMIQTGEDDESSAAPEWSPAVTAFMKLAYGVPPGALADARLKESAEWAALSPQECHQVQKLVNDYVRYDRNAVEMDSFQRRR